MRRPDIPVLTTLRFPAALAIVALHSLYAVGWLTQMYEGLASGVSFFYVLSGFILYYNYFDMRDRGSFWMARFARIWPMHLATFCMIVALVPFNRLMGHAHWPVTLPANLLLVQAWLPFHGSVFSYNGVAWSLSVEAFFYLSFPWLLVGMKKAGVGSFLAGSFVAGLALVLAAHAWLPDEPGFGSYNPVARLFEFVMGMGACRLWLERSRPVVKTGPWSLYEMGSLIAVVVLTMMGRPLLYKWGVSSPVTDWLVTVISAMGFAVLIWVYAHQSGVISRAVSSRFFVRLGEISFAVYMCHQIILRWMLRHFDFADWNHAGYGAVYVLVTLTISYLLFSLVEVPVRHLILKAHKNYRNPAVRAS